MVAAVEFQGGCNRSYRAVFSHTRTIVPADNIGSVPASVPCRILRLSWRTPFRGLAMHRSEHRWEPVVATSAYRHPSRGEIERASGPPEDIRSLRSWLGTNREHVYAFPTLPLMEAKIEARNTSSLIYFRYNFDN